MDRLLRRQLDAIASNRRSGAAELALRAVNALQSWLRRHPKPTQSELLEIARALLHAQPLMAPLLRLANEAALAIDAAMPAKALAGALQELGAVLRTGPERIARQFAMALPRRRDNRLYTYSYSSTVIRALVRARARLCMVYCSEGRPGYEGRITAQSLSRAGIPVGLGTDASLLANTLMRYLVLGADMIFDTGFTNKVGSELLVERIRRIKKGRKAAWILADTTKFWPESLGRQGSAFWRWSREGPRTEVWKRPPRRVSIMNYYFERARFFHGIRILTERGWMTPKQVRRELAQMRISPRLAALAD